MCLGINESNQQEGRNTFTPFLGFNFCLPAISRGSALDCESFPFFWPQNEKIISLSGCPVIKRSRHQEARFYS